jgi:DNA-binding NarL/FixJ family response regulator
MSRALGLTRVAIVDDHDLFAEALTIALAHAGHDVHRAHVDDDTSGAEELFRTVLKLRPRLVLLDLDLGPSCDGTALIGPLRRAGVGVVVVTATSDQVRWGECLRLGAAAVLPKSADLNTILATIRLVSQERPAMNPEERRALLSRSQEERHVLQELHDRLDRLTTREREVLGHLMAGRHAREIARVSVVSEATVRTQVKSILAKLEVSSQLAAVGIAHRVGWRPPELQTRA